MPVVDLLGAIHRFDDGQWCKEALSDCPAYVHRYVARLLPELETDTSSTDDELARQHLHTAVAKFLTAVAALRPVALLIEDLHWADATSLDLLEFMIAGDLGVPVVATWREDDLAVSSSHTEWLARIRRLSSTSEVRLTPLSEDETREQLMIENGIVDVGTVARIHARTGGHPLFTAQLAGQPDDDRHLPRQLAELLDHRLAGLPQDASRVVTALGVADRNCAPSLLGATTGLDHDDLVEALHELASRRLLASDDDDTVRLSHPLLAEAARRRLVPGEAGAWHRALAVSMAASASANAAEVAEHWRNAGEPLLELPWRVVAAQQAHLRTAPGAEAGQWLRALEIHSAEPGAGLDEIAARIAAFDALELTGEMGSAMEVVRAGLSQLDGADDLVAAELLRRLALAEDWLSDDAERGMGLLDRALELLAPHGASKELVHALDLRANNLMDLGQFDDALDTLAQALSTCEELADDELFYGTSATLGWCKAYLGDLEGGLTVFDRARMRMAYSHDPRREAYMAMSHTDALIQHRRPAEEVMAAAQRAIDLGREWDMDFHLLNLTRANVVEALLKTGRVGEAAHVARTLPISDKYDHWPVSWVSAQIAMAQGRLDEGLQTMRGLEVAGTSPENSMHRAHWVAIAHLWLDDARAAWDTLVPALEAVLGDQSVDRACLAYTTVARAGADLVHSDPSRADQVTRTLNELREGACSDPLGPAVMPVVRLACTEQWAAELARLGRADTCDQWVRLAGTWEGFRSPHDAAYCRWRAAQAAFRDGQGTVAARLLNRAATDAREHVPLSEAIAATARVGR